MEAARVCSRCWILRDKPGCDGWGDSAEAAAGLWCHQSPKSGAWGGVRVWGSTRPQPPAVGAGLTACPHQHRGAREPFGTPLKPCTMEGAVEPTSPLSDPQQSQARKCFVSSCAAFPCRTGFAGRTGGARQCGGTASRNHCKAVTGNLD